MPCQREKRQPNVNTQRGLKPGPQSLLLHLHDIDETQNAGPKCKNVMAHELRSNRICCRASVANHSHSGEG